MVCTTCAARFCEPEQCFVSRRNCEAGSRAISFDGTKSTCDRKPFQSDAAIRHVQCTIRISSTRLRRKNRKSGAGGAAFVNHFFFLARGVVAARRGDAGSFAVTNPAGRPCTGNCFDGGPTSCRAHRTMMVLLAKSSVPSAPATLQSAYAMRSNNMASSHIRQPNRLTAPEGSVLSGHAPSNHSTTEGDT